MDIPKHIEDHSFGFASKIIFNNFIKITKVLSGVLPFCMPFQKYNEFGCKVNLSC